MFSGARIFIVPTGIGGPRVNLYKSKVMEHGATVVSDENLATHVIVAESLDGDRISKIVDTANLRASVKIVKCTWLSECFKSRSLVETTTYELHYKPTPSAFTMCCQDSNGAPSKRARLFREPADLAPQPGVSRSTESSILHQTAVSGKWVCAVASTDVPVNKNSHITDQLEAMVETYQSTKDHWRALGYEKAIMQLKRHATEITTWEEARALPNVGKRLADKIWEIVQQGRLQKLEEFQSQEHLVAQNLFTKVWGAGPSTAQKWVQQGFRSLEELAAKGSLSSQQKIGLKHFHDFLDKMPYAEARLIADTVKTAALSIQPGLEVIPCGSYRRGRAMCGDVDILITHPDGKSHEGVLCKILQILHESSFLTDDLVVPHEGGSPRKYMGVCRIPEDGSKHRRLDIFVVPQEEFACSLLAFTGSAHFNRSMRLLARRKSMSLNDHGLYADVCRTGEEKISRGKRLPTPTEESIFEHLGLEYRPPEERDH
ncbi:DNA polymerase lambda-like isoform X2 [Dermacentor albipictus]|uniref:DNA polymerase lambda-like isoform X2 n=1 Tax=Dermacentor albipictus TaxID=60249 RepID=UPI0031FE3EF1